MKPETRCVHGAPYDGPDVIHPITTSVTFKSFDGATKVYSRMDGSQNVREAVEEILGSLEGGKAVLYPSGQAATYSVLSYLQPKQVAIDGGYHGTGQVIQMLGMKSVRFTDLSKLGAGDVLWLETPKNPTCDVYFIKDYTALQQKGVVICVDSTFAPPPVQYCLEKGADFVVHSSTKFLNGHSDAMGGVVVSKRTADIDKLITARMVMGNTPGSLDAWLLLRSLKTLTVRIERQCQTALSIVSFLQTCPHVSKVHHPSLSTADVKSQMHLYGAVLSFETTPPSIARRVPSCLKFMNNATSLGSVESLIEWRHKWDPAVSQGLLRVSVGLENEQDLVADLRQALERCAKEAASKL